MEETDILPIFICVVLPVAIVLIISITKFKTDKLRTQTIIHAIDANKDTEKQLEGIAKLFESWKKPQKTARDKLYGRLLRGCIFSLIGLFLAIIGLCNLATGRVFSSDPVAIPLCFGGISLAIGISFLIVFFATRDKSTDKGQE